ncbi:hypothetical protein CH361_04795 [Leptospira brenneri]|nr:hypothetical protein CH361_04795 [Leptospira brenneri]
MIAKNKKTMEGEFIFLFFSWRKVMPSRGKIGKKPRKRSSFVGGSHSAIGSTAGGGKDWMMSSKK